MQGYDDRMILGPCALSAETIARCNDKEAQAWKGHRLMPLVPLIVIAPALPELIARANPLVDVLVLTMPLTFSVLLLLFWRPYRSAEHVEFTYAVTDEGLAVEYRIDQNLPRRAVVKWRQVIEVGESEDGIVLHLKSGTRCVVYHECLSAAAEKERLLRLAKSSASIVTTP